MALAYMVPSTFCSVGSMVGGPSNGGGVSTVLVDTFQNFSSASAPTALTAGILTASEKGVSGWQSLSGTGSGLDMFTVVAHDPVDFPRPISVDGINYNDSGSQWAEVDYTALGPGAGWWAFRFIPPGTEANMLAEGFLELGSTSPGSANNLDMVQIDGDGGFLTSQVATTSAAKTVGLHNQGPVGGSVASLSLTRKVYFFQMWYASATEEQIIRFFDPADDFLLVGDLRGEANAGSSLLWVRFQANYINLDAEDTNLFGGLCVTYNIAAIRDPAPLVGAPGTITLTALTSTSFSLAFAGVGGATSYRYDVATDSGFSSLVETNVAVANPAIPAATITGLTASTTYYVRARAINDQQTSANSTTQNVTTSAAGSVAWANAMTGVAEGAIGSGERGLKIVIGGDDVEVTHLGLWGMAGQYIDAFVRIRDSGLNIVATVTVPVAGLSIGSYNYVALGANYTMTNGGTYYITRDVSGFNGFAYGTQTVDTGVATVTYPCDETGADSGLNGNGGVNFKHLA